MSDAALAAERLAWRDGAWQVGSRTVPEEVPVAFTYNRLSHAVMMASPSDLEDFALGFSLDEGIIDRPSQIEECEVVRLGSGIELRLWIDEACMGRLETRRRRMAGPTGCGLCGIESLGDAVRPPLAVGAGRGYAPASLMRAAASLAPAQRLGGATRAVHAAGFWTEAEGLVALREDVGRHNALDKLAGALARAGRRAEEGIVVLTSRVSIELIQKAASMGAPMLLAVSAPTALAIRVASQAGITLVGVARADGFEVFTHKERLTGRPISDAA